MLIRIAFRNLLLHRKRSVTVGALLLVGAWLVVVGQAALDAIQAGLQRSVVDSLSGHVQLYDAAAPDKLELYQSAALGQPDLGQIEDFGVLKDATLAAPGVEAIVPMGLGRSVVTGRSILDHKLSELRDAAAAGKVAESGALIAHIRRLIARLDGELDELARVAADTDETERQRADLARASSDAFWNELLADPLPAVEFLDNRIAPLGLQSSLYFIGFVGTDIPAFSRHFKLFDIVEGELVGPGERGFLFSTTWRERFAKNRTARRIDQIQEAIELEGRRIEGDEELTRAVERNVKQVAQLTDQLDPRAASELARELATELGADEGRATEPGLDGLMAEFLTMSDANFARRRAFFYDRIAPRIRLYAFSVGDSLTLYSQTRSGYPRAVNVTVRGIYRLKGLEKSMLAGAYNLIDMMTFRDLTGMAGGVDAADVAAIKARAGIETLDAASAEDALFGEDADIVEEVENQTFDDTLGQDLEGLRKRAEEAASRPFTQAELEAGPIVNAAVFLKDNDDLPTRAAELARFLKGRGLDVQALTWEEARGEAVSGVSVGITVVFYGVVVIVFLVALGVIINSLLMSTTERTREIGTMRAIGAQRGFVVRMFTIEALVTALIFGGLGVLLGALTVLAVGAGGLPATTEIQTFIFGGARLYPTLDAGHVVSALIAVGTVATVACLIPARIAASIAPASAMQVRD